MRSLVGVLAVVFVTACYETPKPACMFLCGEGGACPDGYVCVSEDNRCHRSDPGGPAECEPLPSNDGSIDSATTDAPPIDAMLIDAEPIDAMIDAEPLDAAVCLEDLAPTSDGGSAALQNLVISEINPGEYIELYNNTASPIDLSSTAFQLCSPFNYSALATLAPTTTVPAGGYATVPWPGNFTDTDTDGEIILYADSQFTMASSIMDFVCWGAPTNTRKPLAETAGKWTAAEPCVTGPLTMGALHRLTATDGIDAADYDATAAPSPMTCTP